MKKSYIFRYSGSPFLAPQYLAAFPRPPIFGAPLYATAPAPFHSLFANFTVPESPRATLEFPRTSPDMSRTSKTPDSRRSPSLSPPISPGSECMPPPVEDVKTSSIAALRLAARDHELRLELLRHRNLIC